jgi:PAS domain S-box-containing protein
MVRSVSDRGKEGYTFNSRIAYMGFPMAMTTTDITLGWSAENALAIQNQALHAIDHGVVLVDDTTQMARVNHVAAHWLNLPVGYCPAEDFRSKLEDLRRSASNAASLAIEMSELFGSPEGRMSSWPWHFDEASLHFHLSTAPIESETVRGRVWVFLDVSDLYQALKNVEQLEHRLEHLLTEGDVIAFRLRPGGFLEWMSPSTKRIMGYDPREFIGKHASEFCHPDDVATFRATTSRLRATGEPQMVGFRVPDAEGNVKTFEGRTFLAMDGSGAVDVVLYDISNHVEVERLRSLMVSTASHEFKTPLAFMTTGLAMIEDGTINPATDEGRDVLDRMYGASLRLARMTESLVGMQSLEITRTAVADTPISIARCVTRAAFSVPTERNVLVAVTDESGGTKRLIDQDLLEQAVINLVDNAVRQSPDEGLVDVTVKSDEDSITVIIRDRGPGIPLDVRERIFQPFVRLNDRYRGIGIGLAIVERVAALHHGSVTIHDPVDGVGSEFRLILREVGDWHDVITGR